MMAEEVLGAANIPLPMPLRAISAANIQYGKSIGNNSKPTKLEAEQDHARRGDASGTPAGPTVRPRAGLGNQEAGRQRQQEDAGPQRRVGVVVARAAEAGCPATR